MIYLDSAATSLYKPDSVQYAVIEAMTTMASPGRGTHVPAMKAADKCYECRENLAKLFNVDGPEKIAFTLNATHALNIAIGSVVKEGARVIVSGFEHNSVTRPLYAKKARTTVIDTPLFDPKAFLKRFQSEIDKCDAVVITYASNAFGYIIPVEEIAQLCRMRNKPLVIDASQSAGVVDIDAGGLGAAFIAMPGHKGLMGPQGTGVLICNEQAQPLLYGGSGSESANPDMPEYLPDRLEAGTHNVAGVAGLNEGVKYLLKNPPHKIGAHERELLEVFYEELSGIDSVKLFYSPREDVQCSVISILPNSLTCEQLAEELGKNDVAIRSGLHCAPAAHRTAGTMETGTARFSFSPFLSKEQVKKAAKITRKILENS